MTKKKVTDDLLGELKEKNTDIGEYISDNSGSFIEVNLSEFWENMLRKSEMQKSDVVNKADISYIYFYEILQGKKIPSKDKIVRIALALDMSLEECQQALTFCNQSRLYPRIKRDSCIIYAIEHKYNVLQLQDLLIKTGEPELK